MPRVTLTRRVMFSAAHRYRRPEWDDARNDAEFGKCARPSFHGHTYTCDVTVSGPLDAATGFVVNLAALDAVLAEHVVDALDHRNLVLDVPEFAEGRAIPSSENLAAWIAERVGRALPVPATLLSVRVQEEPGLWAIWHAD
jgi:6-pyruvoyltetrahydropterin/6-carboxytetrahydropterin synthase